MPVSSTLADREAETTWADLHARMRSFVAKRVADPHAADDLAQDILLRIHQRIGDLRDRDRLDAWAYQIARRVIIDHYRRLAARKESPAGDELDWAEPLGKTDEPDIREPGSDAVRAEIAACLAPMVGRLPQPYRDAIELTDLGELTQVAAAEQRRLSVPGMKARVQRGREKLREMLDDCCRFATDGRGAPTEVEARRHGGCHNGGAETSCGC